MIDELRELAEILAKHPGKIGQGARLVRDAASEIDFLTGNQNFYKERAFHFKAKFDELKRQLDDIKSRGWNK